MFPVNLQLGNQEQSPLGYRGSGLAATIDEQMASSGQYQSPIAKQQSERLNNLANIYDSVAQKSMDPLRTSELKDETLNTGKTQYEKTRGNREDNKYWENLDYSIASGLDQIGVIGGSVIPAVVDGALFAGRQLMGGNIFTEGMDAEQLGQLIEETTGLPERYNPLSPNNIVVDEFAKKAAENNAHIAKQYRGSISDAIQNGNWGQVADLTTLQVSQSLPVTIALLASRGAGASSLASLGGMGFGVAGQTYRDLKTENPNFNKNVLLMNALMTGASEAGTEIFGTNLIYDQAERLFKSGAKKEAVEVLRKGIGGFLDKSFKKSFVGSAIVSEGLPEGLNQIIKNATDKWSGVRPDVDYTEGALDATIIGAASGMAIGSVVSAAAKVNSSVNKAKVRSMTTENEQLATYLNNPNITESVRSKILDQIGNNNLAMNNLIDQDQIETAQVLNSNETTAVLDINQQVDQKEQILTDPEMPAPLKEAAKKTIDELDAQADDIIKSATERKSQVQTIQKNAEVASNPDKLSKVVSDIINIGPDVVTEPNYQAIVEKVTQQLADIKAEKPVEGAEPDLTREALLADLDVKITELNKQVETIKEQNNSVIDQKVIDFQSKFPEKTTDLMSDIPVVVATTFDRIESGIASDIVAVDESSSWLYDKYKKLTAMKKSDTRRVTINQIEEVQNQIEKDIALLESYKEQNFKDKTELDLPTESTPESVTDTDTIQEPVITESVKEEIPAVPEDIVPAVEEAIPEPPKQYGYEDIDAMTNEKEVADTLYEEITSPTELSPIEQVIREAGGFYTTPDSYARFGDKNNQNDQMARSYFNNKKGLPLDKIAESLSTEGLEVTPADLKDYMEKFPDGNTTYSDRAKALQNKLFDMTGKKYNKFTVQKFRERLANDAMAKMKAEPGVVTQQAIDLINEEGITADNIDTFQDQIEFILGNDTFQTIKNYLDGTRTETTDNGPAIETGGKIIEDSGTSPRVAEPATGTTEVTEQVEEVTPKKELSMADKIRALKTQKGRAYDAILGLPAAIWDGALETVATAIEAGTSIADAVKKAVAYIQKNSNIKDPEVIENEISKTFEDAGIVLKGLMVENPVPDVVNEIEQTPEEITQENINEFKRRLDKVLKNAQTKALIKSGVAKADLAVSALKAVTEITDRKSMLAAGRAVKKLFTNVTDNAYRSQIAQAKAGLKTRLKGSKLGRTDLMKRFLGINEKTLTTNELEEYNGMVRMLNDQYNSRLDDVVADTELQKFVDKIEAKKVQDILDEQEISEKVEGTKDETNPMDSPRRKQLEAVTKLNRQALKKSGYEAQFKPVAQALLNINTDNLSNAEMRNLNIALINLAVNNRLVGHGSVFKKYVGETGLAEVSSKVGDNIRGLLQNALGASARSLDVNTKIIFKGVKDSALFQTLTGMAGISNGNSQVANIDMKKGLEKSYKNLVEAIKFTEYNTTENRFLRGMYSSVTQFNSIESQQKDFDRYKSLVKQSAEKLEKSTRPAEQREGQLRRVQYDQYLAPFENRIDFENNFKESQPKNSRVVDFFREQFNNKLPDLRLNSEMYAGKNLREVNNYLPMAWKTYSGTDIQTPSEINDIVEPVYNFDPETGEVSEKQSSTTIERSNKSKIKDTDRIMNMDFDRFIFDKYREMNYDIRTLKDRHLYNAIKGQEGFNDVVGGVENSKVLTNGVRNMVNRQMGNTYSKSDIQPLIDASRLVAAKGVRQALFGVTQAIKQYPSVMLRTMINLNSDVGLYMKGVNVGMNNPIFDNFGIGLRGATKGGTKYELELNNIRKSDFSSDLGKLTNAANRISKATAENLAYSLSKSDEAVAKHSWVAYYLQHIKNNGGDISKINWETEHLNPSQEAGAYADLMVSTTQNLNDPSKQGTLLYDNNDAKTIVRDVIAPFSGFARNAQANFEADLRTFSEGTTAEKKAAAWGILSTVSEQVAFNAIKIYAISTLIKAGSSFLQSLFLGEEPEEKEPRESKEVTLMKNVSTDILFGGLGQFASYWGIKGVNQLNKVIQGDDKDLFFQYNPAQYGDPDFGMAGMYGILPQTIYNASQKLDYVDGELKGKVTTKKGEKEVTTNLTKAEQQLVTGLFILDALAIAGISDAEISRLNQTMFRDIKKRTSPTKKFTVEYENKKATQKK